MRVSSLIRLAEVEGGFGTLISRGDPTAGSIAVILLERGRDPRLFERMLQADGEYRWTESASQADAAGLDSLLERRRRSDPDLWVVELDIVSSERFAAEMNALD